MNFFLRPENNNPLITNFIHGYVIQELDRNILASFDNYYKKPTAYLFAECFILNRSCDAVHSFLNISMMTYNAIYNSDYLINKNEAYLIDDFIGLRPIYFYGISGEGIITLDEKLFTDTQNLETQNYSAKKNSFWDKLCAYKKEPQPEQEIIKTDNDTYKISAQYFWNNYIDTFTDQLGFSVKTHFETAMDVESKSFFKMMENNENKGLIKKSDLSNFRAKLEQIFKSLLVNFNFQFSNMELTELFNKNYSVETLLADRLTLSNKEKRTNTQHVENNNKEYTAVTF